ncbi:DNA-binding protein [Vibrio parahaemolyticus]|uniref:DNA-binding protein n=1 Tax=Vibrio parahaemolyticus TaxID=670 RepID=UPI00215C5D17|nr:DNA-binding protein [Vibrio parahaemolyticus]MCS0049039.1 DNA-binding protein [Vibrio parahaemolyticus]MDF4597960.1 DNA-binding protein [Vibrio parahaemolyticus]MDF4729813.1 DNA-binding protein [Vibrio parahaemolyticus]
MTQQGVSFDLVSKAASTMLGQGINPTVRGVIAVTGGKTETVSKHLRDFFDKRNAEVMKMADELGSSSIAKLLASEVQSVVDRKTEQLQKIIEEQKSQLDEAIDLLAEKERDCEHRIELAEAKAAQAINEANDKITAAKSRAEKAEEGMKEAQEAAKEAERKAESEIKAVESKSDLIVSNAKQEAEALVTAADKRVDRSEQEAASLREQVKLLSVEQAKRELEQEQHQKTIELHNQTMTDLAEQKSASIRLQTQLENQTNEISRLTSELSEARGDSKQLGALQGQLIELQKQLSQTQHDLSQSERERESLSLALRRDQK